MAIEKEIKIKADTSDANKSVNDLTNSLKGAGAEAEKTSDKVEDVGKSSKKAGEGTKTLSKGFKAVGTAFKAMGIGLVLALLAKLAEVMSKNQKVMNVVSNVMNSLEIAFNDLFSFVSENFMPAFQKLKDFFNNLTFDKIKKAIKENITERFESLLDVLGHVGKAFKKFFTGDFKGALDEAKNAGKEMVDVMTGIDGSVDKVTSAVVEGAKAIGEYAAKTYESAEAMTELKNNALLAAAANKGLIEDLNIQAEKLRQFRDSDLNSIAARKKANEDLQKVLLDQKEAMLVNANLIIAAAQMELQKSNNIENQVALQEAYNEKKAIEAQIEGFLSEQLSNKSALLKEELELKNSIAESETERQINQLKFDAEIIDNEELKFQKLLEVNEREKELREQQLQDKIDNFKLGTQARIDSENELKDFLQENENERVRIKKEIDDKANEDELKREETLQNAKLSLASNTLSLVGALAKKGSALAKGVAISGIVMEQVKSVSDTVQATTVANAKAAAASPLTGGQPFVAINTISAGLGIAAGAATAAKSIAAISSDKKTVSGGGKIGGGGASAPSFNLVQGTGTNQIAEGLQSQDQPIKAVVVSSDVSTAQEADRKIVEGASL